MSGLSITEQGWGFILACFEKYLGTWVYGVLGILCLVFLLIYKKKEVRFLFGWYPLMLLFTVYNPFLMNYVIRKLDFEMEYYRFFWLLPITFVLAFGFTEIVAGKQAWWKKAGLLIGVGLLLAVGNGDSLKQAADLSMPENVYKVEDDLLALSEIIHAHSKEEQPKVALPLEYNLQARQYDPSLKLTIERNRMLFKLGITTAGTFSENEKAYAYQSKIMDVIYSGKNISPGALKKALVRTRTDYLVAYKVNQVHETIINAGCTPVGETDNAVVYLTRYGEKHNL